MKIAIIGGKLQGIEAAYLAFACGFESILIDANPTAPASAMADRFVCGDVVRRDPAVVEAMKEADFVLPANENDQVLAAVCAICREEGLKLAFDMEAYRISQSKIRSDRLIHEAGIPAPRYYPGGSAPYVIKPSGESGSAGVRYAETAQEAEDFLAACKNPENWIVQEYLEGPSYSIEVIGSPEAGYRTYTVTQIHMDHVYDCCKVTAPCEITDAQKAEFARVGKQLAELVNLHGIMDVEVIDDGEAFKVLEIDARIPSQTPIAVLYSSGMNLLSEIADVTVHGAFQSVQGDQKRYCAYEHYMRQDGRVVQEGEHMMSEAGPLIIAPNFFGSKIAISDYAGETEDFRGIFVNWADSPEELEEIRNRMRAKLGCEV